MGSGDRFAVISDLHANLEAMRAVFDVIDAEGIDDVICLGDIVGYNADPKTVLDLARDRCQALIRGNHDRYVFGESSADIKETTRNVVDWTREQLGADAVAWLGGLEDSQVHDGAFLLAHGSPRDRDEYILSSDAISGNLRHMGNTYVGIDVAFFGHSHFPMVIGAGKVQQKLHAERTEIQLERAKTYLINPGSVGQPRDRCPNASFGIFDRSKWTFTLVRVPYDVEAAQQKILAAGFDRSLAVRLQHGK